MQLQLDKQGVVVVGAGGGIGGAISEAFAAEGASLFLLDQSQEVAGQARRLRELHGIQTAAMVADATRVDAMVDAAERCTELLGTCRHVVVATGSGSGKHGAPFWRVPPEDWEPVLRSNIMACVIAAHAFVPKIIPQGDGSFCFLSSVAGQIGSSTDPPYSAAKAAVLNFTQCAARDLAPYGIRVNAICPGMVRTALNQKVWRAWTHTVPAAERQDYDAWAAQKIARVTPLGRWQEAAEIAAMAVFLASRLGRNMTGQTLNVDGGQVMHC